MRFLLDTNVCIRFLNGRNPSIRQQMSKHRPEDILLCSVVKAELLVGVAKNENPEGRLATIKPFLDRFASLPFDDSAAAAYAEIRADLEQQGFPIGPNDLSNCRYCGRQSPYFGQPQRPRIRTRGWPKS